MKRLLKIAGFNKNCKEEISLGICYDSKLDDYTFSIRDARGKARGIIRIPRRVVLEPAKLLNPARIMPTGNRFNNR